VGEGVGELGSGRLKKADVHGEGVRELGSGRLIERWIRMAR
jgi:hypothetical protein